MDQSSVDDEEENVKITGNTPFDVVEISKHLSDDISPDKSDIPKP